MISPGNVQAEVVDISRAHTPPDRIAVDAQVLYFVYNPNFHFFAAAGMSIPPQLKHGLYGKYLEQLKKAVLPARNSGEAPRKIQLCTVGQIIGEFARTIEFAEIEIRWRTKPNNPGGKFDARDCKAARYEFANDIPAIRAGVTTVISTVRQLIDILPKPNTEEREVTDCLDIWRKSLGDFSDSMLVCRASAMGIANVLSDDADIATFEGITLYTANRNVIAIAKQAGKLR